MVALHAIWMCAAVAVGSVAGYLGLIRSGLVARLPGRFHLGLHVATGAAYYVLLAAGLGIAVAAEGQLGARVPAGREGLARAHEWLAWMCAALYVGAGISGVMLLADRRRGAAATAGSARVARAHMILNYTACALVGAAMVVGLLMVR